MTTMTSYSYKKVGGGRLKYGNMRAYPFSRSSC